MKEVEGKESTKVRKLMYTQLHEHMDEEIGSRRQRVHHARMARDSNTLWDLITGKQSFSGRLAQAWPHSAGAAHFGGISPWYSK